MAGILDQINLKGSSLGSMMSTVDSARPHILGDMLPAMGSSGSSIGASFKNLTGILTERPSIMKSRVSGIQSAPTIMDKFHALVVPPGTSSGSSSSGDVSTQTVPSVGSGTPVYERTSGLTFH